MRRINKRYNEIRQECLRGGVFLIYLYTEKKKEKNWILKNDLYFNLHTANLSFNEEDKKAIALIDCAVLTADNHIETKYGIGTIRNLSSGCKTYLNILKNPGMIVSAEECGANVLELIFKKDNIYIYMNYPERFPIGDDVRICFNDGEIVTGRSGYEHWWNREYERRREDDL